jgi:hypothetical protein
MHLLDSLTMLAVRSSYNDNKKVVGNFISFLKS